MVFVGCGFGFIFNDFWCPTRCPEGAKLVGHESISISPIKFWACPWMKNPHALTTHNAIVAVQTSHVHPYWMAHQHMMYTSNGSVYSCSRPDRMLTPRAAISLSSNLRLHASRLGDASIHNMSDAPLYSGEHPYRTQHLHIARGLKFIGFLCVWCSVRVSLEN